MHLTVQCSIQCIIVCNTVQSAMQPPASHTKQYYGHCTVQYAMQYIVQCATVCLQCNIQNDKESRTMTFASGKVCGSRERVGSSSDGAHGSRERPVCLFECVRELRTITFASGKACGSRERLGSSPDGAHGSRERRGYVCSTAFGR